MQTYNRKVETKEYSYRRTVKIANTSENTYMIPKKGEGKYTNIQASFTESEILPVLKIEHKGLCSLAL